MKRILLRNGDNNDLVQYLLIYSEKGRSYIGSFPVPDPVKTNLSGEGNGLHVICKSFINNLSTYLMVNNLRSKRRTVE